MNTTQGILIGTLIIMFTVFTIGGLAGYGTTSITEFNSGEPTIAGAATFVGSGLRLMWDLGTFQVEGCPAILGAMFDLVITIEIFGLVFFLKSCIPTLGGQ